MQSQLTDTQVRLTRLQLNELELMRHGVYGSDLAYALPREDARVATLRVQGLIDAERIELLDTEATPIAEVRITGREVAGDATWIAGAVTVVREPAAAPHADLRLRSGSATSAVPATLIIGRVRADAPHDRPLLLVDEGDPELLSASVKKARAIGADVSVLPGPAADHLDEEARETLLHALATDLLGYGPAVLHGTDQPGVGTVVLFTGLSGSGKSTIARLVTRYLRTHGTQKVTLLDGDEVRAMLSSGLGFSRADRELNVRRIGWAGTLVSSYGGIAVAAPIAPYASMRAEVRQMAERVGRFVLVHVATPLEVCEARDRKGLYAKARAGEIKEFTGISDPYETPKDADIVVGLAGETPDVAAERVATMLLGTADHYVI
ncbi:adenylyl-sulfate kinase [Demequina mangrovi]|uniref:Adenylyl-sulfate kinase n=1 Tax=Demequina mangrovi TaxID=1043493 RepID=A0A1H6YLF9_9MICO|nr:adenylyl-sulfate kinase [Demequina mangrovi]SEJ40674.1 sulfate adenylyltransferase [Demequina mangrovi]